MAAVTICNDFGAQKNKSATDSTVSPTICHEVMGPDAMILVFWMLSFTPTFYSPLSLSSRLFSSSSLSAVRVVLSACMRILILLPEILIATCASSSPAFHMIHSECKLNKQGDNIQSWHTHVPILNQSVLCLVLTVASWPANRFLRRQVKLSTIPISWRIFQLVIHTKTLA